MMPWSHRWFSSVVRSPRSVKRNAALALHPRARCFCQSGRPGVSLVEVLVVLGIFTVLSSGLFSLFLTALKSYDTGSSQGVSDTTVSLALQKAAREIADGMTATVSSGQLTVQLPLLNNQGNYDRSAAGSTVKLYVSSNKLYKQINSGTATVLESDITAATFTVSGGSVTITLTSQGRLGKEIKTTQMSQVVALRNYDAS
jgi:prepilin-type N-terminal cleavage/methylation domain-containing protein